ncbi:hypothetical protein HAX54_032769, partial [Datura stramonium]|nr:hypothetical protein [Datura stramonium]
ALAVNKSDLTTWGLQTSSHDDESDPWRGPIVVGQAKSCWIPIGTDSLYLPPSCGISSMIRLAPPNKANGLPRELLVPLASTPKPMVGMVNLQDNRRFPKHDRRSASGRP